MFSISSKCIPVHFSYSTYFWEGRGVGCVLFNSVQLLITEPSIFWLSLSGIISIYGRKSGSQLHKLLKKIGYIFHKVSQIIIQMTKWFSVLIIAPCQNGRHVCGGGNQDVSCHPHIDQNLDIHTFGGFSCWFQEIRPLATC